MGVVIETEWLRGFHDADVEFYSREREAWLEEFGESRA